MIKDRLFKLGRDSISYTIGNVLAKAVNFLLIPIYTRIFATGQYGVLDILMLVTTIIITLGNMGLSSSLTLLYFKAETEEEKKRVVTSNFLFSFFFTLILMVPVFLFSKEFSFFFLKEAGYPSYLILAVLTIPFTTTLNFAATLYRLSFKPLQFFYITLGHAVLSAVFSIYFVVLRGMDIMGALLGILISAMIFTAISIYLVRDKFGWGLSLEKFKEMMQISLPLAPVGIGVWFLDFSSRYFLVQFQSLDQVGLYAVGFRLAGGLGILIAAFRLANVPHQFEIAKDPEAKKFYSKTIMYYFVATLFLATILSIFSREIVNIFVGANYFNAYKIIFPLALSFIFGGLYHLVSVGLMLVKKTYYITLGVLGAVISVVIFNILLTPSYGYLGAAVATAAAYFFGFLLIHLISQKHYYINIDYVRIIGIGAVCFVLSGIGMALKFDPFILRIIVKLLLTLLFLPACYFILGKKYVRELKIFFSFLKSCLRPPSKNL
jgi:O-antigen/teichoic acid export membrane protein